MRERGGNVRAMVVADTNAKTIQDEIKSTVEPGSTIYTDEHQSYPGMPEYTHKWVNHTAKEYVNGLASTNGIESVWVVLKRGYDGVYHKMSIKHLPRYINEFAFRLNEGNVKNHTLTRLDSFVDGVAGKRLTYKRLTQ